MGGILWNNRMLTAAGYAAVWAEENSREAILMLSNVRKYTRQLAHA